LDYIIKFEIPNIANPPFHLIHNNPANALKQQNRQSSNRFKPNSFQKKPAKEYGIKKPQGRKS
jgi:hypothetical protein